MAGLAAGVLVQLSSSEESSDEQDSEDDITSSASCSGMSIIEFYGHNSEHNRLFF